MKHSNILNLISILISQNENKRHQLEMVQSITVYLTSDDGISVDTEMYNNHIVRFVITGTRSGMVITYNALTWELCRKPRNEKPWYTTWEYMNICDIWRRVEEITK